MTANINNRTVECGQRNSCRRAATCVAAGFASEPELSESGEWVLTHALYCNVHRAAAERRKYGRIEAFTPIELAGAFLRRYAVVAAEVAAEASERAAAQRAENERKGIERAAAQWASLDTEWVVTLAEEDIGIVSERIEQIIRVAPAEGHPRDRHEITFKQSGTGPRLMYLHGFGYYSPKEMRALAAGLIKGAEIAEATNARLLAKRERDQRQVKGIA